jgi:endonuclease YncB( thermonuclease family)
LILFNGGARTTPEAPEDLRDAEEQAREAGIGIWPGESLCLDDARA